MPTFLIAGTGRWKNVRAALWPNIRHGQGRYQILNRFGLDAFELMQLCFGLIAGPSATLEQLGQTYGFGRRSVWTPAITVIGVLEYLGVRANKYQAPPQAKAYAAALDRAIDKMKNYMSVAPNVLERVLIHDFGMASLTRLPRGLPLCEVPALAAICANSALVQRLRAGTGLTPAQEAIRRRFGFDWETHGFPFRTFMSVAASMNSPIRRVRADIEIELRALGIETL